MIQANQGQSDKSLSSFERSIALLDQLNRDQPGDQAIRADLALAHHYLANTLMKQAKSGRGDASPTSGHRSPQGPRRGVPEAVVVSHRPGAELEQPGRDPDAQRTSRRGIRFRPRGQRDPAEPGRRSTPKTRSCVTRWLSALGGWPVILNTLGRWKESRPLYVESVEIMDRIVAENPAVTEFRRVLATGASELGQYLIDHDEIDAGLNALAKARDQAETVRRTNPNDVRNLNSLASIHRGIGKTRAKQGKTADALDSLRQAIAIGERIAAEDNLFTYDLACGLALYGEVVGRDPARPGSGLEREFIAHYSDKAMTVLQQAVDRGWREADWIERDPELRSLHSRADFQALIKTLRQKPKTVSDREMRSSAASA